jgi:CheY-like chemotaxis protein
MIYSIPSSAGESLYSTVVIKDERRFWKRLLIVDDDEDVTVTFKTAIEDSNNENDVNKRIEVYTSNHPVVALSEFKPNFFDLLLVDINMPDMNGFELCEKILLIDINVKVCFMSSVEINREALREIYPSTSISSVKSNE